MSPYNSQEEDAVARSIFSESLTSCAELAVAVSAVKQAVCDRHVHDVRTKIKSATHLSPDAALDDLGVIIDSLVKLCENPLSIKAFRVGPAHAAARFGQRFSLAEIFDEYVLFRRNLIEHIDRFLGRPLSEVEREMFQSAIDSVVGSVVISFTRQRDARLMLETTALNDFLSSLAHDVRNEVNGVLMSLQVVELNRHELTENKGSGQNSAGSNRLVQILDDLDQSRTAIESTVTALGRILEADRLNAVTLHTQSTELHPLMGGIARSAEKIERAKYPDDPSRAVISRITIDCPVDTVVMTDPDLLSTILINIVGNAVKYSDQEILFQAVIHDKNWRISVTDRGPGMSPQQCEKIFGKFDRGGRVDNAGVGLGLFIAHKAANVLGVQLKVESKLGEGSCVSLTFTPRPSQ